MSKQLLLPTSDRTIIVPTLVVNIRRDDYDVYIGRAGKGMDGYFGNPYRVREYKNPIELFREYFFNRIATDPEFRRRVLSLKGLRLGCFCAKKGGVTAKDKPFICHGQVYAEWLDEFSEAA